MHVRFLLSTLMVLMLVVPALADEEITSDSGPVELEPDTSEETVSIPMYEESGTVNWQEYWSLPAGGGANWGFVTVLYPPDPSALSDCPSILLDSAWTPPIPFAYGYQPPMDGTISTTGWWYLYDGSGNLARRDMDVYTDYGSWFSSTWFTGHGYMFHIETGWEQGFYGEINYMPDEWEGPGIDYFLRSVWFRGVVGGERLQQLLETCGATRIGRDRINAGEDLLAIFQVPGNEIDRQNGRGSLLVWITQDYWQLIQTRLHTVYATEVTEFKNVSTNVENPTEVWYCDYLPADMYWSIDQYLLTDDYTTLDMTPDEQWNGRDIALSSETTGTEDTVDEADSEETDSTETAE